MIMTTKNTGTNGQGYCSSLFTARALCERNEEKLLEAMLRVQ
jgi:hypothetical protein